MRAAEPPRPESVGQRFEGANTPDGVLYDGWMIRSTGSARAGYDDNITLTRGDTASSSEFSLRAAIDAVRGQGPYEFDIDLMLGQTWFPDASENDVTEAEVRAGVVYDTKPLTFYGNIAFVQGFDKPFDNGIFVDGVFEPYTTRPVFRRVPFEAGVSYDIAQVGFEAAVRVAAVDYDTQTTVTGLAVPQDFRSGLESELRVRGSYSVTPDLAFFVEAAAGTNEYDDEEGDHDTWRIVAGTSIEFTRLLIGEASAGFSETTLSNGETTSGFAYRAKLNWFASELVSLTLEAERRFDGEVSTTALGDTTAVPVTYDAVSVRAEWEAMRYLLIHAQAGYESESHEHVGLTDELVSLNAGAVYVLSPSWRVVVDGTAEFGTSDFSSDIERHRVSVGLVASF